MTKLPTKVSLPLSIFNTLSSGRKEQRVSANKKLLQCLASDASGFEYSLKRLISGLASSSGVARQGFAAALCAVLRKFPQQVDTEQLLELFDKYVAVEERSNRQERKEHLFGKVFAALVLVRAGRVVEVPSEKLTEIVADIAKFAKR